MREMVKVSGSLSVSLALGWKLYGWPTIAAVDGVPLISGVEFGGGGEDGVLGVVVVLLVPPQATSESAISREAISRILTLNPLCMCVSSATRR
jgi:hypothetical protein